MLVHHQQCCLLHNGSPCSWFTSIKPCLWLSVCNRMWPPSSHQPAAREASLKLSSAGSYVHRRERNLGKKACGITTTRQPLVPRWEAGRKLQAAGAACCTAPINLSSSASYSFGYCRKCATCGEPANILAVTSTPLAS